MVSIEFCKFIVEVAKQHGIKVAYQVVRNTPKRKRKQVGFEFTIGTAFFWRDTPQGHGYWSDIWYS